MGDRGCVSLSFSGVEGQMMNTLRRIYVGSLLLAAIPVLSQTGTKTTPASGQQQTKSNPVHVTQKPDGQQVFEQNCSRCHNSPPGFSPSISVAVARHMRVRAGLSKEDEQAILRFLNP
jgi:cytochrome c5